MEELKYMISSSSPWQASYISKHLHGFYADDSVCEREGEREGVGER